MPFLSVGWLSGYCFTAFTRHPIRTGSRASPVAAVTAKLWKFLRTSQSSPNGFGNVLPMLTSTRDTQAMANGQFKPPNVLIYTGPDDTDQEQYNSLKRALAQVLNLQSYVVYRLHEHKITTHPWIENTALLVLGPHDDTLPQSVQEVFLQYVRGGGKLLGISGSFAIQVIKKQWGEKDKPFPVLAEVGNSVLDEEQSRHLMAICDPYYFEVPEGFHSTVVAHEDITKRPLIVQIFEGHGTAVFSLLHLVSNVTESDKQGNAVNSQSSSVLEVSSESLIDILSVVLKCLELKCQSSNIPELTPAFLLASKKNEQHLLHSLSSSLKEGTCVGNDMSLYFACFGDNTPNASEKLLPIITAADNSIELPFNWGSYHDQLQTKVLGNVMFYTSVITSTQTVFDGNFTFVQSIPEDVGVVVAAGQQVKGQGRGGNVWLSPVGCMMFSLHVRVPFRTELGSRLPYLQHIASLAAVEAITSLPGYKNINICLKWPNDIYFGKARKIGGVIVTSSASGSILNAVIGMGINVTNSEPTISVNEIISQYNKEYKTNLEALTIEGLMARTINLIEAFIDEFQEHGTKPFLKKYYSKWLHSDTTVSLSNQGGTEDVQIKGLDNFGFLLVQKKSGELCSVQPDGNTFDMLRNLIAIKQN